VLVLAIALVAIAAAVGLAVLARRRAAPWSVAVAAAVDLFVGSAATALGTGHLVGVIVVALRRPGPHHYDFRFASLLLVGLLVATAGLVCITAARGLSRAAPLGWRRAAAGSVLLLLVDAPLIPIQRFAIALAVAGLANLTMLLVARGRYGDAVSSR